MVPYVRRLLFEILSEKRYADFPVLAALVEMMRGRGVEPDPENAMLRMIASIGSGARDD